MRFEEAVKELNVIDPLTKEPVTPEELLTILKEDVVFAVDRPGSWEGTNMLEVLHCHGFFINQ